MSDDKTIGRVLSVDNFRVYIKIEDDLRGAYKNGITDIYEIARINSYLIIPVGSDRIVSLINRVSMKEEFELEKNATSITLPSSARYISATMLGTISSTNGKESFMQGVYNFPSLDNPVWYITKKDLKHIFDDKKNNEIVFENDYYLPIGKSSAFPDFKVKICPDQFFVKHAAILGNTGSGKSCTLTSILRNLFKFNYAGQNLENAHIVILDTNGEYEDAFLPKKPCNELKQINAYYYGGEEKVQVPYWLMNWEDVYTLLKPSDATQAPILNRAIGFAKDENQNGSSSQMIGLSIIEYKHLVEIVDIASSGQWWKATALKHSFESLKSKLPDELKDIISFEKNGQCPSSLVIENITNFLIKEEERFRDTSITSNSNIDLPIYFNYQQLCTKFLDDAIKVEGSSNNKLNEYLSTLRLRMSSFLNDKRMAIPLMLKDDGAINKNVLPQFLALILGDFNKCFSKSHSNNFIAEYNRTACVTNKSKTNQISIIDVSMLPFEVLETVTALIGRIILEFVSNFTPSNRGNFPIVIVLEEAQNYIAEYKESVSKKVFERIAREGRKYGISLIVSSQRPSELSKTVLSQCNSFIIHRLQNPDDQYYVRGLVSSASADILEQLPIIPQQHAIITGDCVRTPIQVRIDDVFPTPNSHNPKIIESWLKNEAIPYESTCNKWLNVKMQDEEV